MHTQALSTIGAFCGLLSVVTAIPALKYSGIVESCGVTTVYVTVAPASSTTALAQLPNTPLVNYGGVSKPGSATTAQSGISRSSGLGSGSGVDTTSTAHLTSTAHQKVFLTLTMTGTGATRTDTIGATYPTSNSLQAEFTYQTNAGSIESTGSASVLMASSPSMTTAQAVAAVSGNYVYTVATMNTQPTCSGDLVTCPEISALNGISSSSAEDVTSSQLTGSTSTPPEVYVVETLTVIPLATLPSFSSSTDQTTILTVQSTLFSTMEVTLTELAASIPVMTNIVYATGVSGTASVSASSGSYPNLGTGGWNMSISASNGLDTPSLAPTRTSLSTTLAASALSSAASTTASYSSVSINFSNSYLFPNVTSDMVAKSGFTALPTTSTFWASGATSISSGVTSLISTSSSVSQSTGAAWADSSTSAIDALQSTTTSSNLTSSFSISSLTASIPAQSTSEAAWTESCSEDSSATSTMDAGQPAVSSMSMTGTSSSSSPSTSYSSTLSLLNPTTLSGYTSSTPFSASSSITSEASSVQPTSSSLSTSSLSSLGLVTSGTPSSQPSSSSSSASTSTTTTTMATTSTLTTSLLPTFASSASSSVPSKASSAVTTSSGLPTSSPPPSPNSETSTGSSSGVFSATLSESISITTSTSTTSLLPISASSASLAEDTRTESITPTSLILTSSTVASSILTFTTLISSPSLSIFSSSTSISSMAVVSATTASSTSSSLPKPTVCGEQGAFTLNFDDLPPLSATDNSTAQPMPLFSPYHQFYFSDGWTIVPPPTDPYLPSSGRLLVEFLPDPNFALGYTGALGNGETALLGCFNFNALGMSIGCDSMGPSCDWQFTGLRYNNVTEATDTITSQMISTAACPALSNCALVPVSLNSTFENLTELRINVTVAGVDKIWWLDDLNLSWFDDSCDAGLCRQENV